MIKKYFIFLFLFSLLGLGGLFAQQKDKALPKANEEFAEKKFVEAEANYRVSQSKFPNRTVAPYNLGNAIYKQNQNAEAQYAYVEALRKAKVKSQKHKILHNLGNTFMKDKNYEAAVDAYKNALRSNPEDEETRYNYALAKKMLKDNPPKNDKDNKKDKDKKDDKKDGDKDKDKKEDKGDQDKKQDPNQNEQKNSKNQDQKGQPKPKPGDISKDRLENLLDAVNNEEKKIQDKVKAKQGQGKPVQTEKDW
ncbi:tetratricopeptide repeat protein [Flavobacterium polysaccharolyticum]|uniref:Tetratricopeptide repeat protein n=1 Tax=Flavobacterium polysaccharolyticum TaxID=3133148 RepID=A0ABU9NPH0_9FLAO